MPITRIIFVRHGQSSGNIHFQLNPENPVASKANHLFELSEEGREQAGRAGEWLRKKYTLEIEDGFAFVSTFLRTQETCSITFPRCRPIVDSRLNEHWRGIWHTMSREDLRRLYPEEEKIRELDGWYHYRAPGGQSCQDVEALIYSLLLDLQLNYQGKTIILFGHGNWQVLFRRIIEHKTVDEALVMQKTEFPPNASISIWENPFGDFKNLRPKLLNFVP